MITTFVYSSAFYSITAVRDRELKLRYLLNFAGISSPAYFMGIFLSEWILFMIPIFEMILLAFMFKLDIITDIVSKLLATLGLFTTSFLQINYLIGFIFKKEETAFKFHPVMIILFVIMFPITLVISNILPFTSGMLQYIYTIYMVINPFNTLAAMFSRIMQEYDCDNSFIYYHHDVDEETK
jgi:hypothetical protein